MEEFIDEADPEMVYDPTEEDKDKDRDEAAVETFLHEFFNAPRVPASNHEEWMLRMCAQMMHREAAMRAASSVSMQGRGGAHRRPRRRQSWNPPTEPNSSDGSVASTKPFTEMGGGSWSES